MGGTGSDHIGSRIWLTVVLLSCSFLGTHATCTAPRVDRIYPNYGSRGGNTKVTVTGCGFKSGSVLGSNTGTVIKFYNRQEYECTLVETTLFDHSLTCTTPPMPPRTYYVAVEMNGQTVPQKSIYLWYKKFKSDSNRTPYIYTITPRSAPPQSLMHMTGKIFTDVYGSDKNSATNGNLAKILRFYTTGKDCQLKDENDQLYGLALYNENTNNGYMKCKLTGTYVGNNNASFILDGLYGGSIAYTSTFHVSANKDIYMFQTYAEIVSVSPSEGSLEGGTEITVKIKNLQNVKTATLEVGGVVCPIKERNEATETLVCVVPKLPANATLSGGRGLIREYWSTIPAGYSKVDDVLMYNESYESYNTSYIEDGYATFYPKQQFVSRARGYFVPPFTGEYSLMIKSDDQSALYLSEDSDPEKKVKVANQPYWTTSYYTREEQTANRTKLMANQKYYFEFVHVQGGGGTHMGIGAKYFSDDYFTNPMINNARPEIQQFCFYSTTTKETQILKLGSFSPNQATEYEVQTIVITSSGKYRLQLYGVYTAALTTDANAAKIKTALQDLPFYDKNFFDFDVACPSQGTCDVTFKTDVGDIPMLGKWTSTGVTLAITEKTKGKASGLVVPLKHGNNYARPFLLSDGEEKAKSAIEDLFSSRCHKSIRSSGAYGTIHYDYDSVKPSITKNHVKTDVEAFCGRGSIRNPSSFYYVNSDQAGLKLTKYNKLCFAYKDEKMDISSTDNNKKVQIRVIYRYKVSGSKKSHSQYHTMPDTEKQTWGYTCIDLSDVNLQAVKDDSNAEISQMIAYRSALIQNLYVDEVNIAGSPTVTLNANNKLEDGNKDINTLRRPRQKAVSKVAVDKTTDSAGKIVYTIAITPINCDNSFSKLDVHSSQRPPGSTFSNTQTTANKPIEGTFSLTCNGQTLKDLPVDLKQDDFKSYIESLPRVGKVSVSRSGSCDNFCFKTTFTNVPGDMKTCTIDHSKVTGNQKNIVIKETDGHLLLDPIPGEFLRTYSPVTKVAAMVNGIPSKCSAADGCEFEQKESKTPTITGVSMTAKRKKRAVTSGAVAGPVYITGTGFDGTTMSNNKVTIGGVPCAVTAATSTKITCTPGASTKGGAQPVSVMVKPNGNAKHPAAGQIMFKCSTSITNISPTSYGLGGGLLTITGTCFNSPTVSVNSANCVVKSHLSTSVTCLVPPVATAASQTAVTITQNTGAGTETVTASQKFDYVANQTPLITSINPSTSSVEGGITMTVLGSDFGVAAGSVTVGGKFCTSTVITDTKVTCVLPTLPPAKHPLHIMVPSKGLAVKQSDKSVPDINYKFKVTQVYPEKGSILGGTTLTILGEKLNSPNITVDVGGHDCEVDHATLTDSKLMCTISETAKIVKVTNKGRNDLVYGKGLAWNPFVVTIVVGDKVEWCWTSDKHVSAIQVKVEETVGPLGVVLKQGGFSSPGSTSKSGCYTYQFKKKGTYYYWSGQSTTFRGTVIVNEFQTHIERVNVKIGDISAIQARNAAAGALSDSSSCSGTNDPIPGVVDNPLPASPDATKLYFTFAKAWTPIVSGLSPEFGSSLTTVNLTGIGYPTNSAKCQAEITFDKKNKCTATFSSASDLQCMLDTSKEASHMGVKLGLQLRVKNRGYGLVTGPKFFAITPSVTKISPCEGSIKGGTTLTIEGYSFPDNMVTVTIGGVSCTNLMVVSHDKVTCVTPPSNEADKAIQVKVGQSMVAELDSGVCAKFSYNSSLTPTCTSVSPDNKVNGTLQTYTVAMDKFGNNPQSADVKVMINGEQGQDVQASNGQISFKLKNAVVGSHTIQISVNNKGYAQCTKSLIGEPVIDSSLISPKEGSIHGGTRLTLVGNGFTCATSVKIQSRKCVVDCSSVTLGQLVCVTPHYSAGDRPVTTGPQGFPSQTFKHTLAQTPEITSVTPSTGKSGDILTITGLKFSTTDSDNTVTINGKDCPVKSGSSSATEIKCTAGKEKAGTYDVQVHVKGKGFSATANFTYDLVITSIAKNSGSCEGNQKVTISGSGIDYTFGNVTICGKECTKVDMAVPSSSQFECMTPPSDTCVSKKDCDVVMTSGSVTKTLSNAFSYDPALTPEMTCVNPKRGGTGGGTKVTITGSKFGSDKSKMKVTIAGVDCVVQTLTSTEITCETGSRNGTAKEHVVVNYDGNGVAKKPASEDCKFHYVDVWSSNFTWGGTSPPTAGDLVVIPPNQDILLDTDTPILSLLLIQGSLVFDEKDITLNAHYILVLGGKLQVGTEENPFQHQATIMMHGHTKSKELPIYGAKCLAVRKGILDLHGKPVSATWTRLENTANADDTQIVLQQQVDWKVGDEIVIATTGHKVSQKETEVRIISAIAGDKKTLTLDKKLNYTHVGVSETVNGKLIEYRAEVGLLTRNVVFRGSVDQQWNDTIEACPQGFNPGEFATQTCFQGRFGEEIGSDQYGAHIIIAPENTDIDEAIGRISHVELNYVGQAFRLGRYPIHFHLNGRVNKSYVKGCSIHKSFNRAVNIHGTHYMSVKWTVIYNIMGGAFFLEDGIEIRNVFAYNLALFVKASSSLLNDDITPAAYWVTHPNNDYINNAGAGGTHFCFWYRMHAHPSGPSATTSVCSQKEIMGLFINNTCHSQGWFGLWIFPIYKPVKGGSCSSSESVPAVFDEFLVWNCEKGVEGVVVGTVIFANMILVNNEKAGAEGKLIGSADDVYPSYENLTIIGRSSVLPQLKNKCTNAAIVMPYGFGLTVSKVFFSNFDNGCAALSWTSVTGTCSTLCGAFIYHSEGLVFDNSPNRVRFRWVNEAVVIDKDGTLTGTAGSSMVTTSGSVPDTCTSVNQTAFKTGLPASICPSNIEWIRFSFNNPAPQSLEYKDAILINQHGNTSNPWAKKRITHKKGWNANLVCGENYTLIFKNAEHMTNFSYTGTYYRMSTNCSIIMRHAIDQEPDRVAISSGSLTPKAQLAAPNLDPNNNDHGDWKYDPVKKEIVYLVSGRGSSKKFTDRPCNQFKCYRCFFEDCQKPANPNTVAPRDDRPRDGVLFWSKSADWTSLGATTPVEGDCPVIPAGKWMVADVTSLPYFKCIKVFGTLEFEDKNLTDPSATCRDFHVKTRCILVIGGRLIIGWENRPFCGTFKLELIGNHTSLKNEPCTDNTLKNAPTCGTKAICVFGGLDIHGQDRTKTWTTLDATAQDGANTITLAEPVEWDTGDEIVIAPTGYNADETEVFTVNAVAADKKQITLNGTLKYRHLGHEETISGKLVEMKAEVGLLSRNVKIIGDLDIGTDAFGARILIGVGSETRGWGRISNAEFVYSGQEGYVDSTDPRYSVSYLDTGDADDIKPSYVIACAFHHGYSPAIGMYSANNITVERNVIYRTVWFAIQTKSSDTSLLYNMIAYVLWEGTFQGRKETANFNYHGAIKALKAIRLQMKGNRVAGAERMAYQVVGQDCSSTLYLHDDNHAHSNLIGVGVLSKDKLGGSLRCQLFYGFKCWRNYDFGIYLMNVPSFIIKDGFYSENVINIFTMVMGPSAVSHQYADKFVEIRGLVVIGRTSAFSCSKDTRKKTTNINLSSQGRTFNNNKGSIIGIVFTSFTQGGNASPEKPFINIMAYPAIKGLMRLIGVCFAHFKVSSCDSGVIDSAITTNKNNDDGLHPMELTNVTVVDVEENSKAYFHPTNAGKVNPSDCVDMDCDGLKKAIIKDETGDFLGSKGSAVIPKAEQRWNGIKAHGTGDYRIPTTMLTKPDGTRIPISQAYDHTGIIRNNQASFVNAWNAYKVTGLDYYMMIVESMDADTELRRLSPIAIRCNGYMDLINGPQDHGWCFGYTCQKRLSTFMIIVSAGAECTMYLSSTNPTVTRFFLLNSTPNIKIGLTIYYATPNRKDVYEDGNLVLPKNAEMKDGSLSYIPQETKDQFKLNMTSDTNGANYFDIDSQELSFVLQGPDPYLVKISATVVLSFQFPPKTLTEVYAPDQIVNNLATYLGVPPNKIRIVNIVRETGSRRKRAVANDDKLLVEIGDSPQTAANQTNTTQSQTEELDRVATNMTNAVLSGKVHEALNVSRDDVKDVLISEPPATDGDKSDQTGFVKLAVAKELKFIVKPDPGTENELFNAQPSIRMFDTKDEPLLKMGSNSNPWVVTVSVLSSTNANSELEGNMSVSFKDGWANFTDLKFSQYGDFVIQFNISYPSEGENFTLNSETLTVAKRQVDASIVGIPDKVAVSTGTEFTLTLIDKTTMAPFEDIAWRNHIWTVKITVIQGSQSNGTLSGTTTATFDPDTGNATFNAISFSAPGTYYIRFTITSTPAEYSFYLDRSFKVLSSKQASLVIDKREVVKMKMEGDYDKIVAPNKDMFIAWLLDILLNEYGDILPENVQVSKGSIAIAFTIGGSTTDVNSTIYSMCSDAEEGKSYNFGGNTLAFSGYLDVGGSKFYGVSCGPPTVPEKKEEKDKLKLILIIVGCCAGLLLILAVAFFILWKCSVHPKSKTTDINSSNGTKYATRSLQDIESILFREKSFQSIGGKEKAPRPPAATNMQYPHLDNGHRQSSMSPNMQYPHLDNGYRQSSMSPVYISYNSQNKGGHRSTTVSPIGEPPTDYPM